MNRFENKSLTRNRWDIIPKDTKSSNIHFTNKNRKNLTAVADDADKIQPEGAAIQDPQRWAYQTLRWVLFFGIFGGVLPISGAVWRKNGHIHFKWFSLATLHTLFVTSTSSVFTAMSFKIQSENMAKTDDLREKFLAANDMLFFVSVTMTSLTCFRLAQKIPELVRCWDVIAKDFEDFLKTARIVGRKFEDRMLKPIPFWRLAIPSAVLMCLGSAENWLYDNTASYNNDDQCIKHHSVPWCDYHYGFWYMIPIIGESDWIPYFMFVVHQLNNIVWNYRDPLLVAICRAVRHNFKMVATFLEMNRDAIKSKNEWAELRRRHLSMCRLLRKIDGAISFLVLQSYAFNMYWLCVGVHLFIRSTSSSYQEKATGAIEIFLNTLRITLMTFSICNIQGEQDEILKQLHLFQPTTEANNEEVERFMSQVQDSTCAITGGHLFYINQEILLEIAGAIFTYELILLS